VVKSRFVVMLVIVGARALAGNARSPTVGVTGPPDRDKATGRPARPSGRSERALVPNASGP
jgi:hypothetical protein